MLIIKKKIQYRKPIEKASKLIDLSCLLDFLHRLFRLHIEHDPNSYCVANISHMTVGKKNNNYKRVSFSAVVILEELL